MKIPSVLFGVILLTLHSLAAQNEPEPAPSTHIVTATEYSAFLNVEAKDDVNYFYDAKMGTDPATACIVRLGNPGKYSYQVIAGRENLPVTYVNFLDEEFYCAWLQNSELVTENKNTDPSLKPNQSCFEVAAICAPQLTMIPFAPLIAGASDVLVDTFWGAMAIIGAGIAGKHVVLPQELATLAESGSFENSTLHHDEYVISTAPRIPKEADEQYSELAVAREMHAPESLIKSELSADDLQDIKREKKFINIQPHPWSLRGIVKKLLLAALSLSRHTEGSTIAPGENRTLNETRPVRIVVGTDSEFYVSLENEIVFPHLKNQTIFLGGEVSRNISSFINDALKTERQVGNISRVANTEVFERQLRLATNALKKWESILEALRLFPSDSSFNFDHPDGSSSEEDTSTFIATKASLMKNRMISQITLLQALKADYELYTAFPELDIDYRNAEIATQRAKLIQSLEKIIISWKSFSDSCKPIQDERNNFCSKQNLEYAGYRTQLNSFDLLTAKIDQTEQDIARLEDRFISLQDSKNENDIHEKSSLAATLIPLYQQSIILRGEVIDSSRLLDLKISQDRREKILNIIKSSTARKKALMHRVDYLKKNGVGTRFIKQKS